MMNIMARQTDIPSYKQLYVQFGCGLTAPAGWLNFDASPRLRLERLPLMKQVLSATRGLLFPPNVTFGDVTKRLPVENNTASCVFCSHILEHLSSQDVDLALKETLRVLMPGGVFRIVVPDLQTRAETYLRAAEARDPRASDQFMASTLLGEESRDRSLSGALKNAFGNSAHRWMFDYAGLAARLLDAGFVDVRRCEYGDASHPAFKDVERLDRFFDGDAAELAIESKKPAS